ncbi:MAG TPA: substrate-binding domain-containing protein [Dehalococcoidia bacterium]|nr:substrate-binding domain-containing protein [Dehalococcoidia bacterium]
MFPRALLFGPALLLTLAIACGGGGRELILATTTSTQDSGLLDVLVPMFEERTDYAVKTIAVGSGAALRLGEEGEADVILAHSPDAEEGFMAANHGVNRRLVMHNDFIIVGPAGDPAGTRGLDDAAEAFRRIAASWATFLSRGDESGTHTKELKVWDSAGVEPSGRWYQETGTGMGPTLLVADEKRGYTLSDRGTYLAQRDAVALEVLVEGDPALFNVYHVMQVNPEKSGRINAEGAAAFAEFITSDEIQKVIHDYGAAEYGQPLFVPDAYLESTPGGQPAP